MAARRKKQARRNDEPRVPGFVWLLSGLLIGGAIAVAVWMKNPGAVNDLLPHPNPAAKPKLASTAGEGKVPEGNPPDASASASVASDASPAGKPKKPRYDFYTLLPEREVVIPDDELSAQVKAEQTANLAAKQQAALAAAAATAASGTAATATASPASSPAGPASTNVAGAAPAHTSDAAPAHTTASNTAATSSAHAATTAAVTGATAATVNANIPVPASQLKSGQYLLQAGAFRGSKQADDLKARIAMLGLVGRVETVQTAAGEMHRVRLGPYATASELEAAKQKLSSSGLPAVAVRVK